MTPCEPREPLPWSGAAGLQAELHAFEASLNEISVQALLHAPPVGLAGPNRVLQYVDAVAGGASYLGPEPTVQLVSSHAKGVLLGCRTGRQGHPWIKGLPAYM